MSGGDISAQGATLSAAIGALVRGLDGVAMLVPARSEVRDVIAHAAGRLAPAGSALGAATGGTFAEPVLVRVTAEEIVVAVDACVGADSSAPDVARAIGAAVREWCLREHPQRAPRVSVRIAGVD
ncbi:MULTISPECIES: hypothetical protein [unclassified Rathayibacter]|uniref:hypothetical protein n=1 Tax=unclassified Rathayibacter TaxID=2609250 RepID=UPI00188B6ADB|nr:MULTISPECIES: hypothetical protein [unclassified Rathayibacter]MBF4461534.1 hypothetical protein [Rathayibacter sp. VKM Ac-2879]MBF4502945.1 hypothetical protein [Rathayibacter sp. VKM Ac-2878]